MDELIAIFVDNYFSEEFAHEIERAFGLIEFFEYKDAYSSFVDILTDESNQSTEGMKDRFVMELQTKLDYMLEQHMVKLTPEATVHQKNEILLALAHVQNLEDYTNIILVLESLEPNEIQFATIMSDLSMLDEQTVLEITQSVSPRTLQILKDFIYSKELERENTVTPNAALVKNFKTFCEMMGVNTLGSVMVMNGMAIGQRFSTYLSFVENDMVTDDDKATAANILSVIYLSHDGCNSPLLVYRKYSYQLLHDLNRVSRVEVHLLDYIAKVTELKKAQDEKARLSTAGA